MKPTKSRFLGVALVALVSATLTFKALSRIQWDEEGMQSSESVAQSQIETQVHAPSNSILSIARATVRSATKRLHLFHSLSAQPELEQEVAPVVPAVLETTLVAAPVTRQPHLGDLDLRLVPQAIVLPKAQENQVSAVMLVKR